MSTSLHAQASSLVTRPHWTPALQNIAKQPLEFLPEFPRIAQRYEAWWQQQALDRPIIIATCNTNPARPITRHLDLLEQPERWLDARLTDLRQIRRVADALPQIRVDFGPCFLSGLMGIDPEFGSDTAWTEPRIFADDWSDAPAWQLVQGRWLHAYRALLRIAAQAARGKFFVTTPDLGGSADVLTNLRGATNICMDVLDQPAVIAAALAGVTGVWREAFPIAYEELLAQNVGVLHWHVLWSSQPYMIPACDLAFSIGPAEFESLCLPDIAAQTNAVGRAIFHLDGWGSAKQIDALLTVPTIQAIQITPGAGTPSIKPWLEHIRKIQKAGRSVLVFTQYHELPILLEELAPEGLGILVEGNLSPAQADELEVYLSKY